MGLIEGWRKIAQLNLSATSVLDNNNARGFGMALASAAADLESASTPRPPKVEWFEKWDSWWVKTTDGSEHFWSDCKVHPDPDPEFGADNMMVSAWNRYTCRHVDDEVAAIELCIPVRREGPPAMDVGWDVVGG